MSNRSAMVDQILELLPLADLTVDELVAHASKCRHEAAAMTGQTMLDAERHASLIQEAEACEMRAAECCKGIGIQVIAKAYK